MKQVFSLLLFSSIALAGICPIEPVEIKPLPPLGFADVAHICICQSFGGNCRWVWTGTNQTNTPPARSLPTPPPSSVAGQQGPGEFINPIIQAMIASSQAQQQGESLRLRQEQINMEREALENAGLIAHRETPSERRARGKAEKREAEQAALAEKAALENLKVQNPALWAEVQRGKKK